MAKKKIRILFAFSPILWFDDEKQGRQINDLEFVKITLRERYQIDADISYLENVKDAQEAVQKNKYDFFIISHTLRQKNGSCVTEGSVLAIWIRKKRKDARIIYVPRVYSDASEVRELENIIILDPPDLQDLPELINKLC